MIDSWHHLSENPQAFDRFPAPPDLSRFHLIEVSFSASCVRFWGDVITPELPDYLADSRGVRLLIACWKLSNVALLDWSVDAVGCLSFEKTSEGISFRFDAPDCTCSGRCEFFMIESIEPIPKTHHVWKRPLE